jgi:hypothetical protein
MLDSLPSPFTPGMHVFFGAYHQLPLPFSGIGIAAGRIFGIVRHPKELRTICARDRTAAIPPANGDPVPGFAGEDSPQLGLIVRTLLDSCLGKVKERNPPSASRTFGIHHPEWPAQAPGIDVKVFGKLAKLVLVHAPQPHRVKRDSPCQLVRHLISLGPFRPVLQKLPDLVF